MFDGFHDFSFNRVNHLDYKKVHVMYYREHSIEHRWHPVLTNLILVIFDAMNTFSKILLNWHLKFYTQK